MKINVFLTILFIATSVMIFTGCAATGTSLVTGQVRPPTNPEAVKLYTKEPAQYETIGIVKASSDLGGWTDQGNLNSATRELKSQAAKLGANGVLLKNVGEKTTATLGNYGGGAFQSSEVKAQVLEGEAIFVLHE